MVVPRVPALRAAISACLSSKAADLVESGRCVFHEIFNGSGTLPPAFANGRSRGMKALSRLVAEFVWLLRQVSTWSALQA